MKADLFDALARRFASAGTRPGTRRDVLRALGVGAGAVAVASELTCVSAVRQDTAAPAGLDPGVNLVADLAFELEYDVEKIFAFVRDEVAYDPYPGVLRGAKGTLWGLAGNAVDQALLLQTLLEASLVPTRLVVGELTDEAAAALLDAGALDTDAQRARTERLLLSPAPASAPATALTVEQRAFAAQAVPYAERVVGLIDQHVADGIETVVTALDHAGVVLPAPAALVLEAERQRHVWVQYAAGPDWIDLDPSMLGARPGDILAADSTTLDALPDDLFHRVTIRLVAEQVAAGGVARTELLSFEAASQDLVGTRMVLMHPEPDELSSIGLTIGGLLDGYRNFIPTLLIDDETLLGAPIMFDLGGGVLDAFGGEVAEGDTLAEWLEVSVTTPLGTSTATRTLFDRIGEEARAAGPVDVTTIAPVDLAGGGGAGVGMLPPSSAWMLGVVTGVVPEAVVPRMPRQDATFEDALPALLAFHHSRDLSMGRVPGLEGCRLYHDAPSVTAFVQRPAFDASGQPITKFGMDLLHRSVAVAPGSGPVPVHPLVAAGVLDHAVEMAIFESGGLEPLNLPIATPTGALRVFAEAKAQGVEVLTLLPGTTAPELPPVGAGASAAIERALAEGQIVIVPSAPVMINGRERTAMWLVDSVTGATRDQMDDGSGGSFQTMPEKALLIKILCVAAGFYFAITVVIALKVAMAANATDIDRLGAAGGVASGVGGGVGCALAA